MAVSINIPNSSNSKMDVTLSGNTYTFYFTFNEVSERYNLDIEYQDEIVIRGLVMIEGAVPTRKYDLPAFKEGELFVLKALEDPNPCGRYNFGVGKSYELVYATIEELTEEV